MTELIDYSGRFDPDFSHDKFSKETLTRLLKTYSEYLLTIDGIWYLTVMDKWGNDEAFRCDVKVWEKALLYELKVMSEALNIHGNDVATVMKYMQAHPWMWNYEYDIDVKNNDHAIVTYHTCPNLLALEKEGAGREKLICQELEPRGFAMVAHYFNPNISVTPLKVPPRTGYNDVCCQWEYRLDSA